MQSTILRPGLLVALSITLRGNVSYKTIDLGTETVDGVEVSKWDTERTTRDKEELERGNKARSKARAIISGVCTHSGKFGLLCLKANRLNLDAAIRDAQRVVNDFNMDARFSNLSLSVCTGEIAPNDQLAIQGIKREMRELFEDMEEGLRKLNVDKIREACDRATQVGKMLSPDVQGEVERAVKAARANARLIVKAGEQAAMDIDRAALNRVNEARTAFLDLDDAAPIGDVEGPSRAVDLEPEEVGRGL